MLVVLQAVVERLNSLFEPDPTLTVTEDITSSQPGDVTSAEPEPDEKATISAQDRSIKLPPSFQTFATVNQSVGSKRLNLSPATLSRFTVIRIEPYTDEELKSVIRGELKSRLDNVDAKKYRTNVKDRDLDICEAIFELRRALNKWYGKGSASQTGMHQLFRLIDFVTNCEDLQEIPMETRVTEWV